jgi:hypothetical protein
MGRKTMMILPQSETLCIRATKPKPNDGSIGNYRPFLNIDKVFQGFARASLSQ